MSTEELITETRRRTHGDFRQGAAFTQQVKELMREMPMWSQCSPEMKESLDMTIHKIHRILTGQPNEVDHWKDVGGYAELIVRILEGKY